jgi:hypothetical protein
VGRKRLSGEGFYHITYLSKRGYPVSVPFFCVRRHLDIRLVHAFARRWLLIGANSGIRIISGVIAWRFFTVCGRRLHPQKPSMGITGHFASCIAAG